MTKYIFSVFIRHIARGIAITVISLAAMAMNSAPTESVKGRKPIATDVTLSLPVQPITGDTLRVSARFSDPDGDTESGSLIMWYHDDGSVISDATGKEYEIRPEDAGKRIQAGYTPATSPEITDPYLGDEVKSVLTSVITARPDAVNSMFSTDKPTLTANGTDSAVLTIALKDSTGNPVEGITDRLSLEHHATAGQDTVALVKNGMENGVYTFSVTGTKTGTIQFTPQIDGKTLATTPATLDLTLIPDGPVQANSSLRVDKTSYTAGDSISVTAELRDANDNPFTGVEARKVMGFAQSTPDALTWTDNGDGIWSATVVAQTAGTGYFRSLKFTDWATPLRSDTYSIVAGMPVTDKSSLTTDNNFYYSGSVMSATVTLRDAWNNPVTGATGLLGGNDILIFDNITPQTYTAVEQAGGSYLLQNLAIAGSEGQGLHGRLKLKSWASSVQSNSYEILTKSRVVYNNAPSTAVDGGQFTIRLSRSYALYNWLTDSRLSLIESQADNGAVRVSYNKNTINDPDARNSTFTVIATPKDPRDPPVTIRWRAKYVIFDFQGLGKGVTTKFKTASKDTCVNNGFRNVQLSDLQQVKQDWGSNPAGWTGGAVDGVWHHIDVHWIDTYPPYYNFNTGTSQDAGYLYQYYLACVVD